MSNSIYFIELNELSYMSYIVKYINYTINYVIKLNKVK